MNMYHTRTDQTQCFKAVLRRAAKWTQVKLEDECGLLAVRQVSGTFRWVLLMVHHTCFHLKYKIKRYYIHNHFKAVCLLKTSWEKKILESQWLISWGSRTPTLKSVFRIVCKNFQVLCFHHYFFFPFFQPGAILDNLYGRVIYGHIMGWRHSRIFPLTFSAQACGRGENRKIRYESEIFMPSEVWAMPWWAEVSLDGCGGRIEYFIKW